MGDKISFVAGVVFGTIVLLGTCLFAINVFGTLLVWTNELIKYFMG